MSTDVSDINQVDDEEEEPTVADELRGALEQVCRTLEPNAQKLVEVVSALNQYDPANMAHPDGIPGGAGEDLMDAVQRVGSTLREVRALALLLKQQSRELGL